MEQIGYSLVDKNGGELRFWGDRAGECPGVPDFIDWPSGDRSYCPSIGMDNHGAKLVLRQLNLSEGDDASQSISFDGTQTIVTRVTQRVVVPDPPAPTLETYHYAIRNLIEDTAASHQYDGGLSLATYVNSTIPQWATEAQAFVAWRDSVWVYAYAQLGLVQQGKRAQPTPADFLKEIPAIVWPT